MSVVEVQQSRHHNDHVWAEMRVTNHGRRVAEEIKGAFGVAQARVREALSIAGDGRVEFVERIPVMTAGFEAGPGEWRS